MGSWIGREGKGYQAWSTYSISPQSSIQASFRYAKIAKDFIPRGSTQWDGNHFSHAQNSQGPPVEGFSAV